MAPRDEAMLVHMLRTALAHDDGPIAFRYPRGAAEGTPLPDRAREIPIGTGEVLKEGERVALLGYGYGVSVALDAAALLAEHDLNVTVADARFAKPLDQRLIERLAAEHDLVVTIEENVLAGGFGSGVLEHSGLLPDARPGTGPRASRRPSRSLLTHGKPRSSCARRSGLTGPAVAERVTARAGGRAAMGPDSPLHSVRVARTSPVNPGGTTREAHHVIARRGRGVTVVTIAALRAASAALVLASTGRRSRPTSRPYEVSIADGEHARDALRRAGLRRGRGAALRATRWRSSPPAAAAGAARCAKLGVEPELKVADADHRELRPRRRPCTPRTAPSPRLPALLR